MSGWLCMVGISSLSGRIFLSTGKSAVDFFNHLNMLYGTVTEFCTRQEVRTGAIARESTILKSQSQFSSAL